jgi:hypothetical protein
MGKAHRDAQIYILLATVLIITFIIALRTVLNRYNPKIDDDFQRELINEEGSDINDC